MHEIFINTAKTSSIYLEVDDYKGDVKQALSDIQSFAQDPKNTVISQSFGYGWGQLTINGESYEVTPYGITIDLMLEWCRNDKNFLPPQKPLFNHFKATSLSTFSPPGIVNFASINVPLEHSLGFAEDNNSPYPYQGEKPGGTDIGHLIRYQDKDYIVKVGITLSLLGQAVEHAVKGQNDLVNKKLGIFIVGNYTRIIGLKDKTLVDQLKSQIRTAFDNYLSSDPGQSMQSRVHAGQALRTIDVYQIFLSLCTENPILKDVIGLPVFADIISGCHSQHFNNVFQLTQNHTIAQHKLFVQPKDQPGIYQGSTLLESKPFDKFLLTTFEENIPSDNHSVEDWITECQIKLRDNLKLNDLNGLCSGILIRHILGESADNGPDNMILSDKGVVNIDLTGFRYPRKDAFNDALGWADTLTSSSADVLLERLFHSSVFKDRFVKDSTLPESLKSAVYNAIIAELKTAVEDVVVGEVRALRDWLATIDPLAINRSLDGTTRQVYASLNDQMKFSEKHLATLIAFNQEFLIQAITTAKTCELADIPAQTITA